MTMKTLSVALVAALSLTASAWAADNSQTTPQGPWEWRSAPQSGPRATGPAQKRVWVPDQAQMANCTCDMLTTHAAHLLMSMLYGNSIPSRGYDQTTRPQGHRK